MKIGVGIIACDRPVYTVMCIQHFLSNNKGVAEAIVVNDGKPIVFAESLVPAKPGYITLPVTGKRIEEIKTPAPYSTVGVAKNLAIKTLIDRGCTHIFLVENDIIIKSADVWQKYIDACNATGITHLNFGYHGPANRTPDYSKPKPRYIVEYPGDIKIALNAHSVGAFSFYDKRYIENVGLHDTFFQNAWEHVELCHRGILRGLLPAFWWFPDIADSYEYLEEIPGSIQNSSITHTEKWTTNMHKGAEYYKKMYNYIPVHVPDTSIETVLDNLKKIYSYRQS